MFSILLFFFISLPILTIAYKLFLGPGESWGHIVNNVLFDYSINSLILCIGCVILTSLFGISSAWIVSRYTIPFRKTLEWMLILPLAVPSYITAYAYAGIFDYGGIFSNIFLKIGFTEVKVDIMNIYGLVLVLSVSLFPYVYISSRAVFLYQSTKLMEASKLLGASEIKTLLKIFMVVSLFVSAITRHHEAGFGLNFCTKVYHYI